MMITTRPLLLHMVRSRQRAHTGDPPVPPSQTPEAILTLAQACIRSARQSHAILTESWISGLFKPFDYARTRYLFSAATILAVSHFLGDPGSSRDGDDFGMACTLMENMVQAGSVVAAEFYQHLEAIRADTRGVYLSETGTLEGGTAIEGGEDAESAAAQLLMPVVPLPCGSTGGVEAGLVLGEPTSEAFELQDKMSAEDQIYLDMSQLEELYWPVFDAS